MSQPDPLILGFDTSAAHCAAALSSGGEILAQSFQEMAKGQAEHLFPLMDDMLASVEFNWRDLSAIGVGVGPGNFTGIRIAVASARGLSLSLGVPSVGISAFDALAYGNSDKTLLTVVDGRRDHVHVQVMSPDGVVGSPETLPFASVAERFGGQSLCVVGHRAEDIAQVIGPRASIGKFLPIAHAISLAAATKLGSQVAPPRPLYVRPADAAPPRDAPPTLLP